MKEPRRLDLRTTVDRQSWKSFQNMIVGVSTRGRGEYLMDEFLRFGRAFTKKPLMSFETTALDAGTTAGSDIRAFGYPEVSPTGLSLWGFGQTAGTGSGYASFHEPQPLDPLNQYIGALGQSFTLQSSFSVKSIRFYLRKVNSPTDDVYVKVSSSMGGTPVATSNSLDGSSFQPYLTAPYWKWETFTFPSPPVLTAGTWYAWLERTGPESQPGTNYYNAHRIALSVPSDPFGGGGAFHYDAGWEEISNEFANADLSFHLGVDVTGDSSPALFGTFHNKLPDGSFEHQAWVGTIPAWNDPSDFGYYHLGSGVDYGFSFFWAQEPGGGWSITDEDHSFDYASQWAAKCVVGDSGATGWLSPSWESMWGIDEYYQTSTVLSNYVDSEGWFWTSFDLPNVHNHPSYIDVPLDYSYFWLSNPKLRGQWINVQMKASAPCVLQVLFQAIDYQGGPEDNEDFGFLEELQEWRYEGTGWQTHEFYFADTYHRWSTPTGVEYGNPEQVLVEGDLRFARLFLRVAGTSGTVVFLDNISASSDWTMEVDMSDITVGVAEWERDPKGMYTGAKLWFKVE